MQYQTTYLLNITPHTSKREEVRVKINGGDFVIYGGGSRQRRRKDLLQLERNAAPSILPEVPSMQTLTVGDQYVASRSEIRKNTSVNQKHDFSFNNDDVQLFYSNIH
jgi:hypothetical protein